MSRKLLIATLVLGSTFVPVMANAADATTTTAPSSTQAAPVEMSKDKWLGSMVPLLPTLICKGFMQDADLKKRFDEIKMNYDQCVSLIPESSKKCQDQIYSQIPETINGSNAGTWGRTLGECIGKDFAEKYLVPKKSS